MRLQNKVAIITGGANGIGKKTVERFLEEGSKVVFTDLNTEEGTKALQEFQQNFSDIHFIKQNVQSESDWAKVVSETIEKFGRIDVLFNNAGIYKAKSIEETTLEDWNLLMGVNVTGVFLGMKQVIPIMKNQRSGSIINASSLAGLRGSANHILYGASKGAVRMMTKDIAAEVAPYSIRVNSIHPGIIQTSMGDSLAKGIGVSTDKIGKAVPLKRTGTPEDIANAVVFLASDDSTYITGTEIVIDGGLNI
ncbi:SDR family NAD(P)-dependent oxidoreductase [Peribacillus butanolivorans]|uniref:SDR family NAD(P)-dependent oxidoreductase n=1 Tax=Peribacillus butanolivorans TaxID=421767 RepID=UPI0036763FDB